MSKITERGLIYEKIKSYDKSGEILQQDIADKFASIESVIRQSRENIGFNFYAPIASQKRLGRFILAYKRFVRKSVAFIFAPILKDQTDENFRFVQTLSEVSVLLKDLHKQNIEIKTQLNEKIDFLKSELQKEKTIREELTLKLGREDIL